MGELARIALDDRHAFEAHPQMADKIAIELDQNELLARHAVVEKLPREHAGARTKLNDGIGRFGIEDPDHGARQTRTARGKRANPKRPAQIPAPEQERGSLHPSPPRFRTRGAVSTA